MEMENYASLRPQTYASQIIDLDAILASVKSLEVGKRFYFTISLQTGLSKVFYVELQKSLSDNTKYVYEFYREYEKYGSGNGMYPQPDVLLKAFVSTGFPAEEVKNPGATVETDSSVTATMANYVEVFLDAVQVMHLI